MTKEYASILSIIVNVVLSFIKIGVGFLTKSAGLIADGLHSILDIFSSILSYLGIKISQKEADKKHPYGYFRAETIASFVIVIFLLVTSGGIIYEGIQKIITKETIILGHWALIVAGISIIANEIISRIKFKVGQEQNSLVLISDAQHSRADSISSAAVLIGIIISFWFNVADGIAAILVGCYILYETVKLGKEVGDNLLDVANPEIEKKIKNICQQEEIKLTQIKTRKLGAQNFAELEIALNKEWKMKKVDQVIKDLENKLLENIKELKFVVIQVKSHNFKEGYIKSRSGQIKYFKDVSDKIKINKEGFRTIISVENNHLYPDFGAPQYLIIDQDSQGNIIQQKIEDNPYFNVGRGHGIRFSRAVEADRVITPEIGKNGMKRLTQKNVIVKIVDENKSIKEIIKNLSPPQK